jgi:hypothetical protein
MGATSTTSPARRARRSRNRKLTVPTHAMKETAEGVSVSGGTGSSVCRTEKHST